MQLFYCPDIAKGELILPTEEAQHCLKVLRKKGGDEIDITDGKGRFIKAIIDDSNVKKCTISIVSTYDVMKTPYRIHIALSPTKSPDRMEWFVEKAVEIGADTITFFQSRYSERSHLNMDRLQKKAISAMKQSERAYLPEIGEMISFDKLIDKVTTDEKFIAHREHDSTQQLLNVALPNTDYTILIGPEGGFSAEEVFKATEKGFLPVLLGNQRLRTETAGVVACTILSMINQS